MWERLHGCEWEGQEWKYMRTLSFLFSSAVNLKPFQKVKSICLIPEIRKSMVLKNREESSFLEYSEQGREENDIKVSQEVRGESLNLTVKAPGASD